MIFISKTNILPSKSILLLVFITPFMFGLYYDFAVFLSGSCFALWLINRIRQTGLLLMPKTISSICLLAAFFCYFISCFYAIDKGLALIGCLRFGCILLFYLVWHQLRQNERNACILCIPYSALCMLIVSFLAYPFPGLRNFFYRADRLGGFFQYSNSFSFFLLVAFVILGYQKLRTFVNAIPLVLLLIGIMATGSRSVFLLTALTFFFFILLKKDMRMFCMVSLIAIVAVGSGYALLSGNFQNIGRFMTISLDSSTFLGRMLYYKDGISLFLQHPEGLGYMGYYYMQPMIQTGSYSVLYIHNEFLQTALDAGVIALIAIIVYFCLGIYLQKGTKMNCIIFILFSAFCMFDLGLTFLVLWYVLIMVSPVSETKQLHSKKDICIAFGIVLSVLCILVYFTFAYVFDFIGQPKTAATLYSGNTFAQEQLLDTVSTPVEGELLAAQILERNSYSLPALKMRALTAAVHRDYEGMINAKKKVLSISRYSMAEYEDYIFLLRRAIDYSNQTGNLLDAKKYEALVMEVPEMINAVKKETDPIAFRLKDLPQFTLSEETERYIQSLKSP